MIIWLCCSVSAFGCMLVWTYAAIRPRSAQASRPPLCVDARVGTCQSLPEPFHGDHRYLSKNLMVMATVWGLVELILAGVARAWAYTEAHG